MKIIANHDRKELFKLSLGVFGSMRVLWACALIFGALIGYMHYRYATPSAIADGVAIGIAVSVFNFSFSVLVPALAVAIVTPLEGPRTFIFGEKDFEVVSARKASVIPFTSIRSSYLSAAGLVISAPSHFELLPLSSFPDKASMQKLASVIADAHRPG